MLTPVEEAGRNARDIADRVRAAFAALDDTQLRAMLGNIRDETMASRVVYQHGDTTEPIPILPVPIPALPDQLSYARTVSLTLHRALKRLPDLYFGDSEVRRVLVLPPEEESWLREYWTPSARDATTMFGRHDAVCDFHRPDWNRTLWFLEPNLSGIGGLHLVPTADRVIARTVLPVLHAGDPSLQLETAPDIRGLLMQELVDHLDSIGRAGRTLCLIEPKYATTGPDDQAELARFVRDHFGFTVHHADPEELEIAHGEVTYRGQVIDLAYRDYGVTDLLEARAEGMDIEPMRMLFARNQMVSSIAAELDQKASFEVLTDPDLLARHFDSDERRLFRRHIPWTRVIADRETSLPDGRRSDLLPFVMSRRESLIIKPNRAYGGTGVVIGEVVDEAAWETAIETAVTDPERWVVQLAVPLPMLEFPVEDAGELVTRRAYVVLGFAPSTYGLAVHGRASGERVVNVARHGGIAVVVIGHAPGRLVV